MIRTPNEQAYVERIRQHVTKLHNYLNEESVPTNDDPATWFKFIGQMRVIQGNISNDLSFLACLLAKSYLSKRFQISDFDAAAKPQGAPGLDIDLITADGKRVIGEIKTTIPYSGANNDLGAQQKASFKKDFDKLNKEKVDYKFFFVTDLKTYNIVKKRYAKFIPDVEIILLRQDDGEDADEPIEIKKVTDVPIEIIIAADVPIEIKVKEPNKENNIESYVPKGAKQIDIKIKHYPQITLTQEDVIKMLENPTPDMRNYNTAYIMWKGQKYGIRRTFEKLTGLTDLNTVRAEHYFNKLGFITGRRKV